MVSVSRSQNHARAAKPVLEIIPDTRFIVFNGNQHEASPVKLTGRIRLTTPESISILRPRIRLEGKRKISWWYAAGMAPCEVVDKRAFWNQEQNLGVETAHKVKAGTIEWPFEFELSPAMPESVEGLRETYIAYHLHANVSRPGWNAKDLLAQTHIRLVRTLGPDSMEMTRSRVNADIWANKISYSISIPSDSVVFGTSITADVELSPLKKGLRLGKIEIRLVETVTKRIQGHELPDIRGDRAKSEETEVANMEMAFPEDSRVVYEDETPDNPTLADEMYKFQATLPLPKSLNLCRQDVDTHQINISHRFKLMVNIHNPEGHVSQLVCRLPVKIFISPNLPVNESNEVNGTINGLNENDLNNSEAAMVAPPEYGRHQLDQMYRDIDPSGYISRAGSGPNTPYVQSRRGSHENTLSLNALSGVDMSDLGQGSAMPSALLSRLTALQQREQAVFPRNQTVTFAHDASGGSSPSPGRSYQHSPDGPSRNSSYLSMQSLSTSLPSSVPTSRRPSDDFDATVIHQTDYDIEALSRVPSYNTSVHTFCNNAPYVDGPPSYLDATSRPPSPAGTHSSGQYHLNSSGTISPNGPNGSGGSEPRASTWSTTNPAISDDTARLRHLRAQG